MLEALNQAIAAALPITVATKGVFALLAALALAELLRRFAAPDERRGGVLRPLHSDRDR